MILLSITGTLRMILILLLIWLVIRMFMRVRSTTSGGASVRWDNNGPRPKGEVRIERTEEKGRSGRDPDIIDADYEEVR